MKKLFVQIKNLPTEGKLIISIVFFAVTLLAIGRWPRALTGDQARQVEIIQKISEVKKFMNRYNDALPEVTIKERHDRHHDINIKTGLLTFNDSTSVYYNTQDKFGNCLMCPKLTLVRFVKLGNVIFDIQENEYKIVEKGYNHKKYDKSMKNAQSGTKGMSDKALVQVRKALEKILIDLNALKPSLENKRQQKEELARKKSAENKVKEAKTAAEILKLNK